MESKTTMAHKQAKNPMLDEHIDEIIDMIVDGMTYRDIAKHFNCGINAVFNVLHAEQHLARARAARETAANTYVDLAESAIKEIHDKAAAGEITRQRELAHHYRWKASKTAPTKYGDKLDVTTDGKAINIVVAPGNADEKRIIDDIGE